MSAKPVPPADDPQVYPVNISYSAANGYQMNPSNPNVPKSDTVKFTAAKSCTIYFNPSNTAFGASQNVNSGSPTEIDVGNSNYSVGYCICDQGSTCTPPAPSRLADDNTGTIKVGSGTTEGGR